MCRRLPVEMAGEVDYNGPSKCVHEQTAVGAPFR
jgi:hypothetical protein